VTAPYSAVSTQVIAPPAAVLAIAPAKVRHGAARLHTAASLPFDATKVRAAWAWAGACERRTRVVAKASALMTCFTMTCPPVEWRGAWDTVCLRALSSDQRRGQHDRETQMCIDQREPPARPARQIQLYVRARCRRAVQFDFLPRVGVAPRLLRR